VVTAGLQDELEAAGSFTVLAPDNNALSAVPGINEILTDQAASAELVNAHLVGGAFDSAAIFAQPSLNNQNGDPLAIDPGLQTITGPSGAAAQIVTPDQAATNGFVHTINAALDAPAAPVPTTTTTV
jgi:uncharacterized surface protein with fasciclin (FAS1) repeats